MPFNPRLPNEIRQSLVARVVATSPLTDVAEGGVLQTILGVVSDELAMLERRAFDMARSHGITDDVTGEMLRDRVDELPLNFPRPQGERTARGGNLYIVRTSTGSPLTIPAGSLEIGRQDDPTSVITNVAAFTFDVGESYMPQPGDNDITMIAKSPGEASNAPAGAYNVILTAPSTVISAVTQAAMTGGRRRETDAEVRYRALLWLSSLARSQPSALESWALSFVSSTGQTFLFARVMEDPDLPGFSYLVVDDGYGTVGYTQPALPRSGEVPTLDAGSRYTFHYDFPAVTAPRLTITRGSDSVTYDPPNEWIAIEERGIMWTNTTLAALDIQPEDTWTIQGHYVYTTAIAELQANVEASWRAAGTRVRVVTPEVAYVSLSGNVVADQGYDLADVISRTKDAIVAHFVTLGLGGDLLMHRLHDDLGNVAGLRNIVFDQGDKMAGSPRHRLTTLPGLLNLR